jgi:hypothetical protein
MSEKVSAVHDIEVGVFVLVSKLFIRLVSLFFPISRWNPVARLGALSR